MGLATVPEVARAGQRFTQPEGDLEGPGKASGSAATSGAAYSGPRFKKVMRGDPTGVKGAEGPAAAPCQQVG